MTQGPWPLKPLVDVVEVLDSRRVPVKAADRAASGGDVPYYGATGQVGFIDRPLFNEPLLLLGEDGVPFLDPNRPKAYLIDGPAWVNNHAHVLRTSEQVDRRFLLYCLNTFDYRGFVNGTTRLKLTQTAMRSMTIPFPDMREQRRIVEIVEDHLSHLDAADASLALALRRLRSFSSLLLDELFGLKSGILTVALDDLVDRVGAGKSFGSSASPALDGEWGIIKVSAMTWGEFDPTENKAVPVERVDPRYEISPGDLLVSRANTTEYVGASVLVREGVRRRLLLSDKSLRVTPRPDVRTEWLWRALQAPSARRQISRRATGTKDSMRNISQGALKSIRLPRRDVDRQVADIQTYRALDDHVKRAERAVHDQRKRHVALRRAVLAAAFSGRLTGASADSEVIEEAAQG